MNESNSDLKHLMSNLKYLPKFALAFTKIYILKGLLPHSYFKKIN